MRGCVGGSDDGPKRVVVGVGVDGDSGRGGSASKYSSSAGTVVWGGVAGRTLRPRVRSGVGVLGGPRE